MLQIFVKPHIVELSDFNKGILRKCDSMTLYNAENPEQILNPRRQTEADYQLVN